MRAPDWLTARPVAHRGLHDAAAGVPENSSMAFQRAIDGRFGIECDVRLTNDGVPLVFHDAALNRVTQRQGWIANLELAETRQLRLQGTNEFPPSLPDLLRQIGGRVPLLIEVKNYNDAPVGPLERAVSDAIEGYRGPVAVMCFNPMTVAWFQRHLPRVTRGQLAQAKPLAPDRMALINLRRQLDRNLGDPHFIGFKVDDLPHPLTQQARARGRKVLAWTVRRHDQWLNARAWADNFIFERLPAR